jgi:hypothetical protein
MAVVIGKAIEDHITQSAPMNDVNLGILRPGLDAEEAVLG